MRKHGIDLWVVPMREYNEDPMFTSLMSPKTFAARRRTIYVFFDKCAASGAAAVRPRASSASRSAARRRAASSRPALDEAGRRATPVGGQQAELWGDEQWQVLKAVIEERKPDGHRHQPLDGLRLLRRALGRRARGHERSARRQWTARFKNAEGLPLDLIASRLPEEEAFYRAHAGARLVDDAGRCSRARVVTPGKTRTSDLVWWWRQRVNDLGLGTWFQPSRDVQRRGVTATQLGDDPVIQRGRRAALRRRHHRARG